MSFNLGLNGRHDFFQDSLYPEENEPNNKKKLDIDRHNSNEESIFGENNLFLFHENRGRNIQVCFVNANVTFRVLRNSFFCVIF